MNVKTSSDSRKAVAALRKAAAFISNHAEEIVGTPYDALLEKDGARLELDLSDAYSGIVVVRYGRNMLFVER